MKTHLAALGAALVSAAIATAAVAQGRPDTRMMSCEQTQALIQRSGAIVLTTGRHTYDRYVAAWRFCNYPDVPKQTWIATRDTPQCLVYNCQREEIPRESFR
ncbi:hypothetical protein [Aquamicrobium sp. LC103]|uniref:hypothetical protein n=1 Tax=Aquamicrobium sp. LC103 TaxID=1120658 RepID=UPI00063EB703|nr:hypothetical protein [Aquamicrobium sp. LC103]TKT80073.1 hypothetical protein XW59_006865 [Aquamicrobium sp. LC103]